MSDILENKCPVVISPYDGEKKGAKSLPKQGGLEGLFFELIRVAIGTQETPSTGLRAGSGLSSLIGLKCLMKDIEMIFATVLGRKVMFGGEEI